MQDNLQTFKALLDAYNNGQEKITQLILDNFLIFSEQSELELLIRNDVSRYCMANSLIIPTKVFVLPDQSKEFDPVISNHEVVLVYRIKDNFSVTIQLNLQINRFDKTIYIDRLISGKENLKNEWQTILEDYKLSAVNFNKIKMLRNCKLEGEKV